MGTEVTFKWLDAFLNGVQFKGKLVAKSGLRVGRGRDFEPMHSDLPLLRLQGGAPYLPGSSLKGVLRSSAEALLRGVAVGAGGTELDAERVACDIFGKGCTELEQTDTDDDKPSSTRAREKRARIEQSTCMVCATFGGKSMASHLKFRDAHALTGKALVTTIRDGVALDRDLGRVAGSAKYDYEVVEPGAVFEFAVDGQNLEEWQIGLMLASLAMLDEGMSRVGGFGSRGLGVVGVQESTVVRRTLAEVLARTSGTPLNPGDEERCIEALHTQVLRCIERT